MADYICNASDRSLLLPLESAQIAPFVRAVERAGIEGLVNLHPAASSVLVIFDPLRLEHAALQQKLLSLIDQLKPNPADEGPLVEIKVRYDGPDLAEVAAMHGLAPECVVELHSSALYRVAFLGFAPGFAYLEGLPAALATPRLAVPRKSVPAGSVAIGGSQTAVYPFATPGGWRLIGRTDAVIFDATRARMSLLSIGDRVRFIPQ